MPITTKLEDIEEEYDIIIAGGGAAGCVLAGKLSEATGLAGLSILVIESGKNNLNDPNVVCPGRYWSLFEAGTNYYNFIKGTHGTREIPITLANVLGGGGSVNFMMYTRASASDYDDWKTEGWYSKDLIPLFRELENYQNLCDPNPDKSVHGFSGRFHVSAALHDNQSVMTEECLNAAKSLGYPVENDVQNFKSGHGFSRWSRWIHPTTQRRQDSAHQYLHPNAANPEKGLTVLCQHRVVRVLVEDGKATGVEVLPSAPIQVAAPSAGLQSINDRAATDGIDFSLTINDSAPVKIKAKRLVVLSTGSLNTPAILERSGVGAADLLEKVGVECIVDLPGVGENYQDHLGTQSFYRFDKETMPSNSAYLLQDPKALQQADEDFKQGKGTHASNFLVAAGKIRPNEEELEEMGPEFRKMWDEYYRDAEDKPLYIHGMIERPPKQDQWPFLTPDYSYITFVPYTMYPLSRGKIHITSGDIHSNPEFMPNYLSHPLDYPPHVLGYKQQREIARRMPSFRGEVRIHHPPFPESSAARCIEFPTAEQRAEMVKTKITYSEEDIKIIEKWVADTFFPTWHWMGTAPMKPREDGGVVDGNLGVYGLKGLKIADLSICPGNVGANTYNTALVVGAKAAEIVAAELGVRLP